MHCTVIVSVGIIGNLIEVNWSWWLTVAVHDVWASICFYCSSLTFGTITDTYVAWGFVFSKTRNPYFPRSVVFICLCNLGTYLWFFLCVFKFKLENLTYSLFSTCLLMVKWLNWESSIFYRQGSETLGIGRRAWFLHSPFTVGRIVVSLNLICKRKPARQRKGYWVPCFMPQTVVTGSSTASCPVVCHSISSDWVCQVLLPCEAHNFPFVGDSNYLLAWEVWGWSTAIVFGECFLFENCFWIYNQKYCPHCSTPALLSAFAPWIRSDTEVLKYLLYIF